MSYKNFQNVLILEMKDNHKTFFALTYNYIEHSRSYTCSWYCRHGNGWWVSGWSGPLLPWLPWEQKYTQWLLFHYHLHIIADKISWQLLVWGYNRCALGIESEGWLYHKVHARGYKRDLPRAEAISVICWEIWKVQNTLEPMSNETSFEVHYKTLIYTLTWELLRP